MTDHHIHADSPGEADPFDERAATWDDDPAHRERAAIVAKRLAENLPLDRSTRVFEYGAGTGLVSQELVGQVGPIVLADTSAGMRQVIEAKIDAGLLADAEVWDLDLSRGPVPDTRFDLVVSVLTLHHVPDLDTTLAALVSILEPGGHLAVVDLDEEDGSFHGDGFGGHHGFDRERFAEALRTAGLIDVSVRDCHHIVRDDGTYPMFLAIGTRPATPSS